MTGFIARLHRCSFSFSDGLVFPSSSTYCSSLVQRSPFAGSVFGDGTAAGLSSGGGDPWGIGVAIGGGRRGWGSASFASSPSFDSRVLSSVTTLTFGALPAMGTGAAKIGRGGRRQQRSPGPPFLPSSNLFEGA